MINSNYGDFGFSSHWCKFCALENEFLYLLLFRLFTCMSYYRCSLTSSSFNDWSSSVMREADSAGSELGRPFFPLAPSFKRGIALSIEMQVFLNSWISTYLSWSYIVTYKESRRHLWHCCRRRRSRTFARFILSQLI